METLAAEDVQIIREKAMYSADRSRYRRKNRFQGILGNQCAHGHCAGHIQPWATTLSAFVHFLPQFSYGPELDVFRMRDVT
jgi:hypothetical protein